MGEKREGMGERGKDKSQMANGKWQIGENGDQE
jgi:hypothetical protein